MQDTLINQEIENLDLSKVSAIQQKRTLAFINHFAGTTVQFLNNFIKTCEQRLMEFERKMEKVEAAMVLLEARLSSVPEVNTNPIQTNTEEEPVESNSVIDSDKAVSTSELETNNDITPSPSVSPEYERFVKMVQVGVPIEAVKLKASVEGLDPNILESILKK